jgi:hypothetical protein
MTKSQRSNGAEDGQRQMVGAGREFNSQSQTRRIADKKGEKHMATRA